MQIEKITSEIITKNKMLFINENGKFNSKLKTTPTGMKLHLASKIDTISIKKELSNHALSPIFEIFSKSALETRTNEMLLNKRPGSTWSEEEALNLKKLASKIRENAKSREFITKLKNHRRLSNKNTKEIIKYIRKLFENNARILVIRIDLGYKRETKAKYEESEILEKAKKQRVEFFKYLKRELKTHLIGFIWKLEYGIDKGYHYHVMLFLDGSKRRQDILIAKMIGEHWKASISKGEGNYFNCNAQKEKYGSQLGIGMIRHSDLNLIANLEKAASYLTKTDYFARLMNSRGRNLGKGNMPKEREKNSIGRPRQK
ncbi:YagK/YfjJ domain-containing protein [Metapseudomonas otitidis]|uniref:YagK/YfjJ domain-containing protein n=1 Tax=Metapseudomonas otitidis TaxID=319939 RepID=UPI00209B4F29|nr:inovirus-type Gp2 protein [Pseudomonas otitidis]MCO7556593.1 inovirus Gp2 family protein [Pseudomonas otitidis]